MYSPPYTFYNTETLENFSIESREINVMVLDITFWEIDNMGKRVIKEYIRPVDIGNNLTTRPYVIIDEPWTIILHRGAYENTVFITET